MSYLAAFWATLSQAGHDAHALIYCQRAGLDVQATYWAGTPYQLTGQQLLLALDRLCRGLKSTVRDGASLWSRHACIFPFAGPSQGAVQANLCVLDGSQDGGLNDFPSASVTGQGVSFGGSFMSTLFAPVDSLPIDSNHLSVYITEDPNPGAVQADIGCANGPAFDMLTNINGLAYFENSDGGMMSGSVSGPLGFTCGTRTAPLVASLYRNKTLLATDTTHANNGYPADPNKYVGIGYRNGGGNYVSYRRFAWASCGLGLSPAQQAATYALVQQFQTALRRQLS